MNSQYKKELNDLNDIYFPIWETTGYAANRFEIIDIHSRCEVTSKNFGINNIISTELPYGNFLVSLKLAGHGQSIFTTLIKLNHNTILAHKQMLYNFTEFKAQHTEALYTV